jgi:phenol hydroxylase P5 protein
MAEPVLQADVVQVTDLTAHVRELVLSPLDRRFSYRPGQWVSIKVPVDQRPPLNRAYSMAEPQEASGRLPLVFDRVPGGLGSAYLYSLHPGDRLSLSGPHGKFLLPEQHEKDLLLIGRYTGIVPIRCMIRSLGAHEHEPSVTVIQAAPAQSELLYHDEFATLEAARTNCHYLPVVSSPDRELDRVMDLASTLITHHRNIVPMICGLKAFVRPLRAFFMEQGFDRREIKIETYD